MKKLTSPGTAKRIARWKKRFLESLRLTPCVKAACAAAGVSRATAYVARESDSDFAEAWQSALDASVDELEARAFQLALEGDSRLVEFMLKSHRPNVYKDTTRHEVGLLGGIVLMPAKTEGAE